MDLSVPVFLTTFTVDSTRVAISSSFACIGAGRLMFVNRNVSLD